MAVAYAEDERIAWRACRDYIRAELKERSIAQHQRKTREQRKLTGWPSHEAARLRALYLIYGLLRGRAWNQIESTHDEPVDKTRMYLVMEWAALRKAGHVLPAPQCIAGWLS